MSDRDDRETFLTRWSRRKVDARHAEPAEGTAGSREAGVPQRHAEQDGRSAESRAQGDAPRNAPIDARTPAPGEAQAPLPTIEELRGLQSEYRDFLRPGVDESLRRAALKKLFQDPHFNVMDGLDTYIDDYTKADPIPTAMLKALNQAQGLIFDREHENGAGDSPVAPAFAAGESEQVSSAASPPATSPPPVAPDADEAGNAEVAQSGAPKPGAPA